ncbi:MAG: hypothetical protein E6J91_50425 [Deltaproteobacteria bacterium]|nr:MAG: hypothetical protein E6J91_50425 [Deltaproteobacteria bacterium]
MPCRGSPPSTPPSTPSPCRAVASPPRATSSAPASAACAPKASSSPSAVATAPGTTTSPPSSAATASTPPPAPSAPVAAPARSTSAARRPPPTSRPRSTSASSSTASTRCSRPTPCSPRASSTPQIALRAAGSGSRPVVREAERAWSGWLDDQPLTPADLIAASEAALQVITPGGFEDGERPVVLDPSVVAVVLDAVARGLLTAAAARRPEVARRLAAIAASDSLASPLLTLIDDPTIPGAYGGFAFDDEGEPAAPITLVDAGRIAAQLSDRAGDGAGGGAGRGRRPGHLGHVQPAPSHLRLVPGTAELPQLLGDGFLLQGGVAATLDPSGERIRVACTHARELKAGNTTGRLYADVELVGPLTALLTAIDAVAATPTVFASRGPIWRSISAPAVRTRGFVRAVRTRA